MFYTYILFSPKIGCYYTGHTNNLDDRLRRHNSGYSKAIKKGIPWELVYSETFDSRSEATQRELQIKAMKSRKYIEELIKTS